ncbi:MAG: acyltransferase [Gemmatimonadales bacterium]
MSRRNIWSQAADVAARTPESRNRYVDFLRALSICAVITGHWLVAAPVVVQGELTISNMLQVAPWVRWLTWVFQVMPVFFLVGGYANGVSWRSAKRDNRSYGTWLNGRLQRLIGPVLPLLAIWIVFGIVAQRFGMDTGLLQVASQLALVPIWFLAVYVMVVVMVPATFAAWERFGLRSFWILIGLTILDDILFFSADLHFVGWANYAFIWFAVHQLGYAWRDEKLGGPTTMLVWGGLGFAALLGVVFLGPYPISMVSVPGDEISNTLPPKLPMLALGIAQSGLLLALEFPLRRWLARAIPWTATVLVNGMIMTIYLWHVTALTVLVGVLLLFGAPGLALEPGSGAWWVARPVWMVVLLIVLALFTLAFGRLERGGRGVTEHAGWRLVMGAVLVCGGLSLLALNGIASDGWLTSKVWILALPFAGAALAGVNPARRAG